MSEAIQNPTAKPCHDCGKWDAETWPVPKDLVDASIEAIKSGIEYTREALAKHDTELGRTTRKNKMWAEQMERDIAQMELTLAALKLCGPSVVPAQKGDAK